MVLVAVQKDMNAPIAMSARVNAYASYNPVSGPPARYSEMTLSFGAIYNDAASCAEWMT
jgi:hypothetical protein